MVAEGWAMAYREDSPDYIPQEGVASAEKVGIWAGLFVAPWDWRRGERITAEVLRKEGGCSIKGNISAKGERIYHVPRGEYYEKTQISAGKGERWFCSEAEAQAAGRSEEHTSELQSLMRISYAVFCLKKKDEPDHTTTVL